MSFEPEPTPADTTRRLAQLRTNRAILARELNELHARSCTRKTGRLLASEQRDYDTGRTRLDGIDGDIRRLERIADLQRIDRSQILPPAGPLPDPSHIVIY